MEFKNYPETFKITGFFFSIFKKCKVSLFRSKEQRGSLMDKTLVLSTGRSGVRIPGRGKCSLRTIAVDARVKYLLYLMYILQTVSFSYAFVIFYAAFTNNRCPEQYPTGRVPDWWDSCPPSYFHFRSRHHMRLALIWYIFSSPLGHFLVANVFLR